MSNISVRGLVKKYQQNNRKLLLSFGVWIRVLFWVVMADLRSHVPQRLKLLLVHKIKLGDEVIKMLVAGIDMCFLQRNQLRMAIVNHLLLLLYVNNIGYNILMNFLQRNELRMAIIHHLFLLLYVNNIYVQMTAHISD